MREILLDTHAFIWLVENDSQLPASTKDRIEECDRIFISIISFWLGKMQKILLSE